MIVSFDCIITNYDLEIYSEMLEKPYACLGE